MFPYGSKQTQTNHNLERANAQTRDTAQTTAGHANPSQELWTLNPPERPPYRLALLSPSGSERQAIPALQTCQHDRPTADQTPIW